MKKRLWELTDVTLDGQGRARLDGISLDIVEGVTALIGPSGAGKTSLLNLLVEFERPDAGGIVSNVSVEKDGLPLFWVPQNGGLWPHLTAQEHLTVVCPNANSDEASHRLRITDILARFDLTECADAIPGVLSEGQRSRLAVARAVASQARVLVMDEPLAAVDQTRLPSCWEAIREHARQDKHSLVFATHAVEPVLREADQAVCLSDGRLVYCGDVQSLYRRPATRQLSQFLGPANWFTPAESSRWLGRDHDRDQCFRPEQIGVTRDDSSSIAVKSSTFAGSMGEVRVIDTHTQDEKTIVHRPAGNVLRAGDRVALELLIAILCAVLLVGCGRSTAGPELTFREIKHWSLPAQGRKIPAPRGIAFGPDKRAYILDDAGRVLVYNADGTLQRQWMMPEYEVGKPEGICIFADSRIAVTDTHYHRVVIFDQQGRVVHTHGKHGRQPGDFIYPVAIAQDPSGNYYVCEYGDNDRIQKFSVDSIWLAEFGGFGTGPAQFQRPSGIVWHDGQVYVADAINNRIQVFSDEGQFVRVLDSANSTAKLHYPYDLTKCVQGLLYLVEYGSDRVSCFDRSGNLRGRFGAPGSGAGNLSRPWGLAIDSDGRLLVADTGNRRVVELRP